MSRLSEALSGDRIGVKGGMSGPQLFWPQKDVDALFSAMRAGMRELNWSLGKGVKKAAWSISRTLGTSTRVSKKLRTFTPDIKDAHRRKLQKSRNAKLARRGMSDLKHTFDDPLFVTKTRKGKQVKFRAKNKNAAKKSKYIIIKNSGLAKASWGWGMKYLGSSAGAFTESTKSARYFGSKHIQVGSNLRGNDPHVKITNSVGYITRAMVGGEHRVDTAMERAGSSLMYQIENTLREKLGLARA